MPTALEYGLEVSESLIFGKSNGVSTPATSWWMHYKTIHYHRLTFIGLTRADMRFFVKCDSEAHSFSLHQMMIHVGELPSDAVKLRRRRIDS